MKIINVGVIGLGRLGQVHAQAYRSLKNVNLYSICDISDRRLSRTAKKYRVKKTYHDYREMLENSKIDAVSLCLPNYLYHPTAIAAAEMGKHIFVEKPLARNSREAEEILKVVKKNNVKCAVGFSLRFDYRFRALKQILLNGSIGKVKSASAGMFGSPFHGLVPKWLFDREKIGGGVLIDLGCHMIDLMRWYFGNPSSIFASLKYLSDLDMEDQATIILDFNGTNAIIQTGWFTFGEFFHRVELHGTERIASSFDFADKELQMTRKLLKASVGKVIENFGNLSYYSGDPRIFRELDHFTKCLRENRDTFTSGKDALASLKIIEAAYESDKKGCFIQIK